MEKLKNIYIKDINREIQGVIKVDDETFISQELEEYVVTEELLKHFRNFFSSYNVSLAKPTENMGVWISGFFGSGKSHFLKIISYLLENKTVNGKPAVDYFDDKITDPMLLADMKRAGNISSDVILFNIDSRATLDSIFGKDRILSVFEKVFNEKLGLSTIPHVAELERYLQKNGKYEEFKNIINRECNEPWENVRNDFYFKRDEIVIAYSESLGKSKEEAENWFDKAEDNYDISISKFANRVKEYVETKGNGHHVVFLIDEVGQYVGQDKQALLNLQTLVEDLGTECGGKAWVCVTSQEAIDEVVKVFSDEFSKIQGRFDTKLSLSSTDTDEVIKKRILAKTETSQQTLELLYSEKESIIKNLYVWSKAQTQEMYENNIDFANTYPFIPYQFKLLQNVFTDIRTKGFAGKHLSSGERSLLGAFQETAKRYSDEEVGFLVPFYAFYDTIEQFLEGTVKRVFQNATDIMRNGSLKEIDINVLKILFMLKNIDYIPTNIDNIAILSITNVDEDKLQLKQEISASLKRLENETLIQRINEEYKFLTDDEQEINKEIKRQNVGMTEYNNCLKEMIFDKTLVDRKFTYRNNPFDLTLFLNDSKVTAREYEIGVKVVITQPDKDDTQIIAESMRNDNLVYILLEMNSNIDNELWNVLKVEEYVRSTSRINKTLNIQEIIRAKSAEASETKERIRIALADNLKSCEVIIGGEKQIINAKEPVQREKESLEKLVVNKYSKLDYIVKNMTTSDIRELFHQDRNQLKMETEFVNAKALEELKNKLLEKNVGSYTVTINDILIDFKKSPYGYREEDILYLLTKLLKDEFINLIYASETQGSNNEETLTKILNRSYHDKTIIKLREKISMTLINDVKKLALNSFDKNLPDAEDDIVKVFTDTINDKINELSRIQGEYSSNRGNYRYPGENTVEETINILKPITRIKGASEFFESVSENKTLIESNMDKIKSIIDFFKGPQKKQFDDAKHSVIIYEDNKQFAGNDESLISAVKAITDILTMEEPFSNIHELPHLRENLNNILAEMYDKRSIPVIEQANNVIEFINNEIERTKIDSLIGEKYINDLRKTIDEIDRNNQLKDILASETFIKQRKEEFSINVEKELARLEMINNPSQEIIEHPKIERKRISADSLISRTYEIDTEEDIDKLLKEIKEKLLKELNNNSNLSIR